MPQYLSPGVYVEEVDSGSRPIEGVGTAVAGFVGLAARGPANEPTLVTNWSQFTQTFGDFTDGSYLAQAVYGFFLNGGGSCYVVRIEGDGVSPAGPGELDQRRRRRQGRAPTRSRALEPGAAGQRHHRRGASTARTTRTLQAGGQAGRQDRGDFDGPHRQAGPAERGHRRQRPVQAHPAGGSATGATPSSARRPAASASPAAATDSPARLSADDYVGDPADRTGFAGLEAIDEVTMLAVPDLMAAYQKGMVDLDGVQAVQLAMIAHCELMGDRVAILDPPPGLNAQQVHEWRVEKVGYDSKYATLYWPWIKVFDPANGQNVFVPPSGHMAGIWSRNDDTRGVHKAPGQRGRPGRPRPRDADHQGRARPAQPGRRSTASASFPGRGIRVWGARTLSSDPAWRYLNIRRLFNYLEESILNGTQWAVFEPNDRALWARIRRTIEAFLVMEWRKGALFGLTPDEAFYVKCDDETNPAEGIDLGQVVCEIGVAPVKPAEFVIFRLSQYSGGASLVE